MKNIRVFGKWDDIPKPGQFFDPIELDQISRNGYSRGLGPEKQITNIGEDVSFHIPDNSILFGGNVYREIKISVADLHKCFPATPLKTKYMLAIADKTIYIDDGHIKIPIKRFKGDSIQYQVLEYVMTNPNRNINREELTKVINLTKDDRIDQFIYNAFRDYPQITKLCFNNKTTDSVTFNPIFTDTDFNSKL